MCECHLLLILSIKQLFDASALYFKPGIREQSHLCKCGRGSSLKKRLNFEPISAPGVRITCRRPRFYQPVGVAGSKFSHLRNNKGFRAAAAVSRMEGWLTLMLVISSVVGDPSPPRVPPPVWSQTYAVEGTLSIPYAEIEVKFNISFFSNLSRHQEVWHHGKDHHHDQ